MLDSGFKDCQEGVNPMMRTLDRSSQAIWHSMVGRSCALHVVGTVLGVQPCSSFDAGNVNMQDLRLHKNRASRYGGGVYVLDHVVDFVIQYVEAKHNVASVGGALASESSSRLIIDTNDVAEQNANIFKNNTAVVAGGVYYHATRQRSNRLSVRI